MEFILNTIFWTLALYGLFEIIKTIINIYTYTNLKSDGIYVIVAVKNQENKIEGFLRNFLFRIIYGKEENAGGGKRQPVHDTGRFLQTRVPEHARTGGRWILPLYQQQREVSYGQSGIHSRPLNVPL